jgi:hypothetical protein
MAFSMVEWIYWLISALVREARSEATDELDERSASWTRLEIS